MHSRDDAPSVSWIDSDEALAACARDWGRCLTIDTEFMRTNTYYPIPGLYQVGSGNEIYLLDPLAITDWQPFVAALEDPHVVKVMHACQEDNELIFHHLGVRCVNLFDTQFAHAFVSDAYSLSYSNLVEQRLGVALDKHETRSDWLARPLSDRQIEYAVEDVLYLEALYEQLINELQAQGKEAWFMADMAEKATYQPVDPAQYYHNIKKAWHLSPSELARLAELCAWREVTARRENIPRKRVVWDEHLYAFACSEVLDASEISEILPRGVAHRYTKQLLEVVQGGSETTVPVARPLTSKQNALVKQLRECGLKTAEARKIAPELVCRKRDLEACVRHFTATSELPTQYLGWRESLVGAEFLSLCQAAQL